MARYLQTIILSLLLSLVFSVAPTQAQSSLGNFSMVPPIDMTDPPVVPGTSSPNWGGYCVNSVPENIVTWQTSTGATSYDLYRGYTTYSGGGEFPYGSTDEHVIQSNIPASSASLSNGAAWGYPGQQLFVYTDTNPPYTNYGNPFPNVYYFVIAKNSAGATMRSGNTLQIDLACEPGTPPPPPPAGSGEFPITVTSVCQDANNARLDVSWSPYQGADSYEMYVDGILKYQGAGTIQGDIVSANTGGFTSVSVIAYSQGSITAYSSPVGSTVQVAVPDCAPPVIGEFPISVVANCADDTTARVDVNWDQVASATNYSMYVDGVLQYAGSGTVQSLYVPATSVGTASVSVIAYSDIGVVAYSAPTGGTVQVNIPNCTPPPPPPDPVLPPVMSVEAVCSGTLPVANLSWTVSTDATSYNAHQFVQNRTIVNHLLDLHSNSAQFSMIGPSGATEEYSVTAINPTGNLESNTLTIAVPICDQAPGAFDANAISSCIGTQPVNTLSWTSSPNAQYYVANRTNGTGLLIGAMTTPTPISDAAIATGTVYTYRVWAANQVGAIASSTQVSAANCQSTPGVNTPPDAVDDSSTTLKDTPVVIDILNNDSDAEGPLDIDCTRVVTQPANGTVSINATNGRATYTPNSGYTGTDTFVYEICDSAGLKDTATVTVSVTQFASVAPPTQLVSTGGGLFDGITRIWLAFLNFLGLSQ